MVVSSEIRAECRQWKPERLYFQGTHPWPPGSHSWGSSTASCVSMSTTAKNLRSLPLGCPYSLRFSYVLPYKKTKVRDEESENLLLHFHVTFCAWYFIVAAMALFTVFRFPKLKFRRTGRRKSRVLRTLRPWGRPRSPYWTTLCSSSRKSVLVADTGRGTPNL